MRPTRIVDDIGALPGGIGIESSVLRDGSLDQLVDVGLSSMGDTFSWL